MRVEKISNTEFQSEIYLKVVFAEDPKIYGRLTGINETILICWNSELIEPSLVKNNNNLLIGVDNKFAIYHLVQKVLIALFPLSSRFLSVIIRKNSVVVVAELEVIVLNISQYSIINHVNLPDVVEDYQENEKGIKIICMDETALDIVC